MTFKSWVTCTQDIWNVCLQTYRNNRTYQKLAYFLRNIRTSLVNNSRILRIKNAKCSGYYIYMSPNIYWNSQLCISVPLMITIHILLNFFAFLWADICDSNMSVISELVSCLQPFPWQNFTIYAKKEYKMFKRSFLNNCNCLKTEQNKIEINSTDWK